METIFAILREGRRLVTGQPSLRQELARLMKIVLAHVHGSVRNADYSLRRHISMNGVYKTFEPFQKTLTLPGTQRCNITLPPGGVIRGCAFGPGG